MAYMKKNKMIYMHQTKIHRVEGTGMEYFGWIWGFPQVFLWVWDGYGH